jgi:prenyltransferase beta subunit
MLQELKLFQREDGAMMLLPVPSEADMRSCYCAAAITHILTNSRKNTDLLLQVGFNQEKLKAYVQSSLGLSGGYGDPWNFESHSGLTYCAVACMKLLGQELIEG